MVCGLSKHEGKDWSCGSAPTFFCPRFKFSPSHPQRTLHNNNRIKIKTMDNCSTYAHVKCQDKKNSTHSWESQENHDNSLIGNSREDFQIVLLRHQTTIIWDTISPKTFVINLVVQLIIKFVILLMAHVNRVWLKREEENRVQ